MSRLSIARRMERVRDAMLPPGSLAWRLEHLPDHLKRLHQMWRQRCETIISRPQNKNVNRYEALLNGERITPPMPPEVSAALGIDPYLAIVTRDRSMSEIQERWTKMLEEE